MVFLIEIYLILYLKVKKFMSGKCLNHLAIPRFIAQGIFVYNKKEYRFLVIDRYQKDFQSVLEK